MIAGIVSGAVLKAIMVAVDMANGKEIWGGMKFSAAPFLGERAMRPGMDAGAVLAGLMCHELVSIGWGALFGLLVYGQRRSLTMLLGGLYGVVVWLGMFYVVLPLAALGQVTAQVPVGMAILNHVVFGLLLALAFLPFQRHLPTRVHRHRPASAIGIVIALFAVAAAAGGCKRSNDEARPAGKAVEDTRDRVREALPDVQRSAVELRQRVEQLDARARARLVDLDAKVDLLRQDVSTRSKPMSEEARRDYDAALERLATARTELRQAVDDLGSASEDKLDAIETRANQAMDDMQHAYDDATDGAHPSTTPPIMP